MVDPIFERTLNHCLTLKGNEENDCRVEGYCDSDYAGDLDKRMSLSGYVFAIG